MSVRVSCEEIARAIDRLQAKLELDSPNRLHRLIAERTGLHTTTVLRYHQGRIESASARILACLLELEAQVDSALNRLDDEEEALLLSGASPGMTGAHSSAFDVRRLLERILKLLEQPEPGIVYRYAAERLGISARDIERMHSCEIDDHPEGLPRVLMDLERRLDSCEPVVFNSTRQENQRVVPRKHVSALLGEIRSFKIVPDGTDLESTLEQILHLERGTLAIAAENTDWPFVRLDLYHALLRMRDGFQYDPTRRYEIGDRIHHHQFGNGRVIEKRHKSKILVEFDDGRKRLMCEEVKFDPLTTHTQA